MSLRDEGDRYNKSIERLKRLRERGIIPPWERDVEDSSKSKSRRGLNTRESESLRETEDTNETIR